MTVERDWFWFWFWFYYALWLASVFTLVLVLRQSSENRSKISCNTFHVIKGIGIVIYPLVDIKAKSVIILKLTVRVFAIQPGSWIAELQSGGPGFTCGPDH